MVEKHLCFNPKHMLLREWDLCTRFKQADTLGNMSCGTYLCQPELSFSSNFRQLWIISIILQDSQFEDTVSFPVWRRTLISKLRNTETKPKGGILFGGKLHRSEQIGLNCKMGVWLKVCIFSKNAKNRIKSAMKL